MVSLTEKKTAYLFLVLPLVCVGFILFTIGYLVVSSFTSGGTFVGFQNFTRLFTDDPYFWPALWHNIFWMIWAVVVPIGIGLVFAILLSRNIRGERIFKGVVYFPALLAGATIGVIWNWFYLPEDYGVLNSILGKLGLSSLANPNKLWINVPSSPVPFLWLVTIPILMISIGLMVLSFRPKISKFSFVGICVGLGAVFPLVLHFTGMVSTSLISILLASSWAGSAISMVMFLAGMQSIPRSQLEAAKMDGASEAQTLRHVILPALKPIFIILIILSAISSMKAFDIVYTLAGAEGGAGHHAADVLALYTYRELKVGDYGYASTIGLVGILVTMIPVIIYLMWIRRREAEE
ncbi:MAG TPA: sugar ABC transporter permease [Hadesarchaea archaeon]|nr:sugar ABC transporter permease [Hadesarchaea archaeon]